MNKLKGKNLIVVLSYIWLFSLIPLLLTEDKFVKFHSKQGTRLAIIYTPIILILLLLRNVNILYRIIDILIPIVSLLALILSLIGTYDIFKNKTNELPIINKVFNRRKL